MVFTQGSSQLRGWQADGCCQICIITPLIKASGSLLFPPPSLALHCCSIGLVLLYVAMTHFSHSEPNFVCQLWGSLAWQCKETLSAPIRCPHVPQHGQWPGPRPSTTSLPEPCPGALSGLPASLLVSSSDAVTLTNLFLFLLLAVFLKLK